MRARETLMQSRSRLQKMGESRPQSSATYLMLTTLPPSTKVRKKPKGELSFHVLGIITILTATMDRHDRERSKVDQMEERPSLIEEYCLVLRVVVEGADARTTEMMTIAR